MFQFATCLACVYSNDSQFFFNYITEKKIFTKNTYNMDEKDFFISFKKPRRAIVRKCDQNLYLVWNYSREDVIIIEIICGNRTTCSSFLIFHSSSLFIGNFIHAESEGKVALAH